MEAAERAAHERARIVDALARHGGPLNAIHLRAICELTFDATLRRLGELVAEGVVRQVGGGLWEVVP